MALAQVQHIYDQLHQEFQSNPNPDLLKCEELFTKAKVLLTPYSFLTPPNDLSKLSTTDLQAIQLSRDLLELGALISIHAKDLTLFERYWHQLSMYPTPLPSSTSQGAVKGTKSFHPMLLGLFLLNLLAQNRMAEFHALMEQVSFQDDPYGFIQYSVKLEQALMEGSYHQVWHKRTQVPSKECLLFIDLLMDTVRNEIASCAMSAYTSLPVQEAMTLFFFTSREPFYEFCQLHQWKLHQDTVYFSTPQGFTHRTTPTPSSSSSSSSSSSFLNTDSTSGTGATVASTLLMASTPASTSTTAMTTSPLSTFASTSSSIMETTTTMMAYALEYAKELEKIV